MKKIPNEAKERLSYNPESGVFIWVKENKHHPRLTGCEAGSEIDGYLCIKLNGIAYKAHRLAWFFVTGEQPVMIDHKNGNGLDNRFSNLRKCNNSGNAKNHGRKINGSGLPCGVRSMPSGRYQSRVICDGKTYYLGTYKTAQEAEIMYKAKRAILFKEYNRI